jgi:electron transport complex protein RnfE
LSNRSLIGEFTKGLIEENATFRMVIGMCPTLAVTTSMVNGFWMGLAVIFVLTFSNVFVSVLRKVTPDEIRIPVFVILIAAPVVIVELVMNAYLPDMYRILGIFVPLIVVNCIIIARAEAFAYRNSVIRSAFDGLGIGTGFMLDLMLIGAIREFLGTGTVTVGSMVFPPKPLFEPMAVMLTPPGGFVTLGILMAVLNILVQRSASKKAKVEA